MSNEILDDLEANESTRLKAGDQSGSSTHLETVLRPFFKKYDRDSSGTLDLSELNALFVDLGENFSPKTLQDSFRRFDTDNSGFGYHFIYIATLLIGCNIVDFQEFVRGMAQFIREQRQTSLSGDLHKSSSQSVDNEEDDEEEEEMPEDLAHLSPSEQQRRLKFRSFYMVMRF